MKNKQIVDQLKKIKTDSMVDIKLHITKYGLNETCYHSGTWKGYSFYCESSVNWKRSEAESEMDLDDLIKLLKKKDLPEMSSVDFSNISLGEASDGSTEVSDIEWTDGEPTDDEKEDLDPMDLYWNSDINDADYEFPIGSIWMMEINIDGETFNIEN